MNKNLLLALPVWFGLAACGSTSSSIDTMPDLELLEQEMAGYEATGKPAFDNAGGALAAICTVIKASYTEAVSAVEDSPLMGQFHNSVEAAGDDEAARAEVFATMTADQRASLARAEKALKGPMDKVIAEMAKTALHSKLLREGMKSLSGGYADALSNAKAISQIKNVLEDLSLASEMGSRIKGWKERAAGYQREADAVKN